MGLRLPTTKDHGPSCSRRVSPARYLLRLRARITFYVCQTTVPRTQSDGLTEGRAFDPTLVRALCFDIDGTLADTDDHLVAKLADLLDAVPLISGRRAEQLARQTVMTAANPVNTAYAKLDALGLDT